MMNRRTFNGYLSSGALLAAAGGVPLAAMYTCNSTPPTWVQTALSDLPTVASFVATIVTIVADAAGAGAISPAIVAVINTAANAIQVAVPIIEKAITDYNANPNATLLDKIQTLLADLQANLSSILDAAHVKNAALQATISGIIAAVLAVVNYIVAHLPVAPAALTAKYSAVAAPTPASMLAQGKQILEQNGYAQYVPLLTKTPAGQ